jgi:NAD(P)-dependent dehydrogenase (short-subunit alcohol dehydrogenase family)
VRFTVTSGAHRNGLLNFSNLNLDGIYTPRLGYAQSKTANILMANQIERLYGPQGVHGLSVNPGVFRSGAQRYDDPKELERRIPELKNALKATAQGAATTVWAAVAKVLEGVGGKYLEDCREGKEFALPEMIEGKKLDGETERNWLILNGGYFPHAFDEEAEKKLWSVSCQMVGVSE